MSEISTPQRSQRSWDTVTRRELEAARDEERDRLGLPPKPVTPSEPWWWKGTDRRASQVAS